MPKFPNRSIVCHERLPHSSQEVLAAEGRTICISFRVILNIQGGEIKHLKWGKTE